ncbi:redoxin domain-containing protein [bacterium]|nr:redoxin domain-containing protein [bacterium]
MRALLTLILTLATAGAVVAAPLAVGDAAPPLSVATWVRGQAVDPAKDASPRVYVVEFWATWCAPCRQSIPHLSQLQEKYKDKVTIVGISDEKPETVRPFVEQMKMAYTVGIDPSGATHKAWMEGVPGIPHAFAVQAGRILWAGHPMGGLEEALARVLSGDWNIEKARKVDALTKSLEAADSPDAALPTVDELVKLDPSNLQYHTMKVDILTQKGDLVGARSAREAMIRALPRTTENLNQVAWMLATHEDIRQRDLAAAYRLGREAMQLSGGRHPAILDTMARVYFELGLVDRAIDAERRALELATDANMKAELAATLAYFESARQVRQEAEREL